MAQKGWRRTVRGNGSSTLRGASLGRGSVVRKAGVVVYSVVAVASGLAPAEAAAASSRAIRLAQRTEARINIAPTIVAEPASQASVPIQVGPTGTLPSNTFVRVRGLPPSVSLTEGYSISPGSWAVPLVGLPSLKANVPAGVSGRSELIITLVNVDGTQLAEAKSTFIVGPPAMLAPAEKAAPGPQAKRSGFVPPPMPAGRPDRGQPTPRPPDLSAEEKVRADRLLAQGERYLENGNIELARQFFLRAAETGLATGAMRLAATYDPAELARLHAHGVVADRAEARKWYERARELGAPEAEERLARLGGS